jgi:hypothetical protein
MLLSRDREGAGADGMDLRQLLRDLDTPSDEGFVLEGYSRLVGSVLKGARRTPQASYR